MRIEVHSAHHLGDFADHRNATLYKCIVNFD